MIKREVLYEMFANMRRETNWNVDGVLLWGYFFTALNPQKLEKTAKYLIKQGYDFVQIYETDDGTTYVLHVEQAEKHTPETLHIRNCEFENLASDFGLESYDGMDVGQSGN